MSDLEADRGFLAGLREKLRQSGADNIKIEEHKTHINDRDLADKLALKIDAMVSASKEKYNQ